MLGEEKALFTVCLAWSCFVVALSCSSVIWPSSTAQRTYIVLAVHALSGVREIRLYPCRSTTPTDKLTLQL